MQYFTFCQSDLILEKTADGYAIPQEPPTETKPWTTVMNVDGAKAYRITTDPFGTIRDVSATTELLQTIPRGLPKGRQVPRTALLGPKHQILWCLWRNHAF